MHRVQTFQVRRLETCHHLTQSRQNFQVNEVLIPSDASVPSENPTPYCAYTLQLTSLAQALPFRNFPSSKIISIFLDLFLLSLERHVTESH